jgi:IS30 family transposase
MTTSHYKHLQPDERVALASLRLQGSGVGEIARALGRSTSTISRELRRNRLGDIYQSPVAERLKAQRRQAARPAKKLATDTVLWPVVVSCLDWRWSPMQIARTLRRLFPQKPELHVSHETIYTAIYATPRGELKRQLVRCLRQAKNTRRPRSNGEDRRGKLPDMLSIHVRPPEVNDRLMPGHWEGDLIKGAANQSAVGVLVERTTGLVLLAKMADATAASALEAFTTKLNQIAAPWRKTLTYDQGREMARHAELALRTGMTVYFCDPHSPWQRGSCENTNGLLRQYLPKGTDLSVHSQEALDDIADQLNNRPRQRHGFFSPIHVFRDMLIAYSEAQSAVKH